MPYAAILFLTFAAQAPATATFDGLPVTTTSAEQLAQHLRDQGAIDYVEPPPRQAGASGSPVPRPNSPEMDEAMIGIFRTPFSTLLRPPRHMPDIREIEIAYCPADGSIAGISVGYSSTLTTVEEFNAVVSELTRIHGRPTYTGDFGQGNVASWSFPDDTVVDLIRPYYGDGIVFPFQALYVGRHEAVVCNIRSAGTLSAHQ